MRRMPKAKAKKLQNVGHGYGTEISIEEASDEALEATLAPKNPKGVAHTTFLSTEYQSDHSLLNVLLAKSL